MTAGYLFASLGTLVALILCVATAPGVTSALGESSTAALSVFTKAALFVGLGFALLLFFCAVHFAHRAQAAEEQAPYVRNVNEIAFSLRLLFMVPWAACFAVVAAFGYPLWEAFAWSLVAAVAGGFLMTFLALAFGFFRFGDLAATHASKTQ